MVFSWISLSAPCVGWKLLGSPCRARFSTGAPWSVCTRPYGFNCRGIFGRLSEGETLALAIHIVTGIVPPERRAGALFKLKIPSCCLSKFPGQLRSRIVFHRRLDISGLYNFERASRRIATDCGPSRSSFPRFSWRGGRRWIPMVVVVCLFMIQEA